MMGMDEWERENNGDFWTGEGSERCGRTRVSRSCRGTRTDRMVAQNEPWMDIEWTVWGMTESAGSWILITQRSCPAFVLDVGIRSIAREQIKDREEY